MTISVVARFAVSLVVLATFAVGAAEAQPCAGLATSTCDNGDPCVTSATCPGQVDCVSDCFRGSGSPETECFVNLLGARLNYPADAGPADPSRKKEIRCTDGDACDEDGAVNNRCRFALRACLANSDLSGTCAAQTVSSVAVKNKKGAKADAALTSLQASAGLLLPAGAPVCAESVDFDVPVRTRDCASFKSGKAKVSLRALAGAELLSDSDTLKLTCMPAAEAACTSITGYVTGPGNVPLAGALVRVGAKTAETDLVGAFALSLAENGQLVLRVSKQGYLDGSKLVEVAHGEQAFADVALLRRAAPFAIAAADGGTASDGKGNRVVIPADAFVDAAGNPLPPGAVIDVSIVAIDPTTDEIRAFPGGFNAIGIGGEAELLQTITLAELSATLAGAPLQLAPGKTALLELLVPAASVNPETGLPFAPGDTAPMYWLNPATAIWERDGTGTAAAYSAAPGRYTLTAQVNHFSWWNYDIPMSVGCIRGKVVDDNANAASFAKVVSSGLDYEGFVETTADEAGNYCVRARIDSSVRLDASILPGSSFRYTGKLEPVATLATQGGCEVPSSCIEAADIVIPVGDTCVKGRVTSDAGAPTSGALVSSIDAASATSAADGTFCVGAATDSEIVMVAAKGSQFGSASVTTGAAGASCAVSPANCMDAGDVVLSQSGCPGGSYLTGIWRARSEGGDGNSEDFNIVEAAGNLRMTYIGTGNDPSLFQFFPTVFHLERDGTVLTMPFLGPLIGYQLDCETMVFEGPDGRATFDRIDVRACGDSTVNGSEECDDGNLNDADGCARVACSATTGEVGYVATCVTCRSRAVGCGNGQPDAGEQCDDGNAFGFDTCTFDCTLPVCGNGEIDQGEPCDNGAANSDTTPGACRTDCQRAHCGDGVTDAGETCDDANVGDGDGCSSVCQTE